MRYFGQRDQKCLSVFLRLAGTKEFVVLMFFCEIGTETYLHRDDKMLSSRALLTGIHPSAMEPK